MIVPKVSRNDSDIKATDNLLAEIAWGGDENWSDPANKTEAFLSPIPLQSKNSQELLLYGVQN
jgi:hypothetical protein